MHARGLARSGRTLAAGLLALGLLAPASAPAGTLRAEVRGEGGEPLADAAVWVLPREAPAVSSAPSDAQPGPPANRGERAEAVVDQVDKEFVPFVRVVRRGTAVHFPNNDQIRHHVYSFSEAKTFEIPLYEGVPAEPVLFEKTGVVPLGCNIHDWMSAYVLVVDTPWFAVTGEDGTARIADLPPGDYEVRAWHPTRRDEPASDAQRVSVDGDGASVSFSLEQKRLWRPRRGGDGPRYR